MVLQIPILIEHRYDMRSACCSYRGTREWGLGVWRLVQKRLGAPCSFEGSNKPIPSDASA